jgi:hypothetical protein
MGAELGLSLWGKEHRLRVSENRVLRKIYGNEREKAGHVARMWKGKMFTGFWFGGPKGTEQ